MGMAFYYAKDPVAQWRSPLGIALIWPIMMLAILPFVPESPRFLLMKGRVDEARDIVMRLHAIPGDEDQEFARGEFYQMQKQADFDRTQSVSYVRICHAVGILNANDRIVGYVRKESVQKENCSCCGIRIHWTVDW